MSSTASSAAQAPSMVQRMTAIIDAFEGRSRCRSLEDVAAITGLPRSTTHRILDQLVDIGWLVHSSMGYSLGWRTRQFKTVGNLHDQLREIAASSLHELAMHTGLVVHLVILEGPSVRYLDKVGGALLPAVPSRVGGCIPADRTAVGRACLAYLPAEEVDDIVRQHRASGGRPVLEGEALHRELSAIRRRGGIAFLASGASRGLHCVAAAIHHDRSALQAGISLCDTRGGQNLERFAPLVLDRARSISARVVRAIDDLPLEYISA